MPVPEQKPAERLTLTALHNDWRKLAAFMGWPWKGRTVTWACGRRTYQTPEEVVRSRWIDECFANYREWHERQLEAR